MLMKYEITRPNINGQAEQVKLTYSGSPRKVEPDVLVDEPLDSFIEVDVYIDFNQTNKLLSYAGHSVRVLGSNVGYIPAQPNIRKLYVQGCEDLLAIKEFEYMKPQMDQWIEDYIAEETKGNKTFSMKGDLNKAIFIAGYLYYHNAITPESNKRMNTLLDKFNMTKGTYAKNLSRLAVPLDDVKVNNKFKTVDKIEVNNKTVFLMTHQDKKLAGGYMTGYAEQQILNYVEEVMHWRPDSIAPECRNYVGR